MSILLTAAIAFVAFLLGKVYSEVKHTQGFRLGYETAFKDMEFMASMIKDGKSFEDSITELEKHVKKTTHKY